MTRPIEEFRRRAVALDTETALVQDGLLAPPLVIGSFAGPDCPDGLLLTMEQTRATFVESLRSSDLIVGANIAYDMAVLAAHAYAIDSTIVGPHLLREIFAKYDRDEVYDVLIAEALNAIAGGHLFADAATGGPLLDPRGRQSARYSLDITVKQVLGRDDAKVNDFWRLRYAILAQVPLEHWPVEAVQYPKDDARNTLEVAVAQVARHENLHDMPSQARAAFALHLASTWGLRADPGRVAALRERVTHERDYEAAQWIDVGFLVDGKKDGHEIKRRLARAYGAAGTCPACLGTGRVSSPTSGNQIYCTVKAAGDFACDGTGLDLDKAPLLPRTPTGGIGAGRDELRESGDEDLMGYADWSEDERVLTTYLPFLEKAAAGPVNVRPNVLLATGRTSYDGIMQTMPRDSKYWCFNCKRLSKKCKLEGHVSEVCGVRECFAPRPGFYYCSTDYASGELCTLAQVCLWTVGHSSMAEVINATRDPGMLHTELAAQMLGVSVEEFATRVRNGDKVAKAYRQAAKAGNFGFPGGMGAAKFVLSKRKKAEGQTTGPDGRVYMGIRFCILLDGAERCGEDVITEWRGRACPPVCRRCVVAAENLKQEWLRRWSEMPRYFAWVSERVEATGTLEQFVSRRVRGGLSFCDGANTLFQGLLADGAKRGLWLISCECYVDPTSPLYGSRPVAFFHDEVFSEVPIVGGAEAGEHQAELMIVGLKEYVPDVYVACEPALMKKWSKAAETRRDASGTLVPFDS